MRFYLYKFQKENILIKAGIMGCIIGLLVVLVYFSLAFYTASSELLAVTTQEDLFFVVFITAMLIASNISFTSGNFNDFWIERGFFVLYAMMVVVMVSENLKPIHQTLFVNQVALVAGAVILYHVLVIMLPNFLKEAIEDEDKPAGGDNSQRAKPPVVANIPPN